MDTKENKMKITETIHALKHRFQIPVSPEMKVDRFVYSYIVFGKEGVYLVDSGVMASEKAIYDYITRQGRSVAEIKSLFLTHSHPDHVGSVKLIKAKSGCKLFAHAGKKNGSKTFKNSTPNVRCRGSTPWWPDQPGWIRL